MRAICCSVRLRIPIFSLRDHSAAEVYISPLLPPPRTALSLLIRGLGEINRVNPESDIGEITVRELMTWAIERSSYDFVKPISPICRSSQTWRVQSIEKEWIKEISRISDAVNMEVVCLNKISIYYYIFLDKLEESLQCLRDLIGLDKLLLNENEVKKALLISQRLGNTEHFVTVEDCTIIYNLKSLGREGLIDTYIPLKWLKNEEGINQGIIEDLYTQLLLSDMDLDPRNPRQFKEEFKRSREKKERFLLPLLKTEESGRRTRLVWYKPFRPKVTVKEGFTIAELNDGTHIPVPEGLV